LSLLSGLNNFGIVLMCLSQVGLCMYRFRDSKYNVHNMLTLGFSVTVCSGHAWHAWNIASGHMAS